MTKYKLCLSTVVEARGLQTSDEEALRRLQEAFTADEGRRFALHAEAIAHHMQQLLSWALCKDAKHRRPTVGLDASDEHETRILQVDCLLKAGEVKDGQP
jgi:hypothetical protein